MTETIERIDTAERWEQNFRKELAFSPVPLHLHGGIERWVLQGIPTGSFLYAVLTNNLADAVMRADSFSLKGLPDIIKFLWHHAPSACWRSPERVDEWSKAGGWRGLNKIEDQQDRQTIGEMLGPDGAGRI